MTFLSRSLFLVSTHDYHKHSRIASPICLHAHFCSSHCSPILGIKICFLNGRKELPNQSFLFYFLHAATVGGRGVCVAQTCTGAVSMQNRTRRHDAPHAAEQAAALMNDSQFNRQFSARRRHWGQGSPCKLRFGTKTLCLRFSCAARKA